MKFPIGCADFKKIRERKYYYVDKTALINQLIDEGERYFLSRPRRFGKSLLVSTLKHLFEGKKELFKGLSIEDKWDWSQKYPVVRLSMTGENYDPESISRRIIEQITIIAESADLDVTKVLKVSALGSLNSLLFRLYKKTGKKAVVLVDEYDAPITDVLTDTELAKKNSDYLRKFYRQIKDSEEYTHFVFVTGITMFSKDSVFTGLNNLKDISLVPRYGAICGYTDHDIDTVFAEEIKKLDRNKIKRWYNGYNWLGEEKVYNPFCILNLFYEQDFDDWWFKTATPKYIYEYFTKNDNVSIKSIENCWIDRRELTEFDIDLIIPQALLFQSGYLTIGKKKQTEDATKYFLKVPNFEVHKGMCFRMLHFIIGGNTIALRRTGEKLLAYIAQHKFAEFQKELSAFLADVPHQLSQNADLESHYHLILYSMFGSSGVVYTAEESTNLGNSDIVLFLANQIFVIELKMLLSGQKIHTALKNAIQQIKDRRYADKHKSSKKPIYLLGMVFSKEKRNIVGILHEELDDKTA